MDLYGTLSTNLTNALLSARRLRGHPVHGDTLEHWRKLIEHARRDVTNNRSTESIRTLIIELENEMANRTL